MSNAKYRIRHSSSWYFVEEKVDGEGEYDFDQWNPIGVPKRYYQDAEALLQKIIESRKAKEQIYEFDENGNRVS